MNKKTVEHISKGLYIALLVLAAAAILTAMVCGPMGMDTAANTASVCACVIAVPVLLRTIAAMRTGRNQK